MISIVPTYCKPRYGALKGAGSLTPTQKSHVVSDTLTCKWIRTRIVVLDDFTTGTGGWTGSSSIYDLNVSLNLKQVVVLNFYPTGKVQPFPTSSQLAFLVATVTDILNTYTNIKYVAIDNEPQTTSFHSGPMSDYAAALIAIKAICKPRGIVLTDGGITNVAALRIKTYQWIVTKYSQAEADVYAGNSGMTTHQINYAKGTDTDSTFDSQGADLITLLNVVRDYCTYANHHYYEVANDGSVTTVNTNVFRYQKEYISDYTKKRVISNECGVRGNTQPALVTALMNEIKKNGLDIHQYWDGTGTDSPPAEPLTDDATGTILANGITYRTFIQANY